MEATFWVGWACLSSDTIGDMYRGRVFVIPWAGSFRLMLRGACFGMMVARCGAASDVGVVAGRGHCVTLDAT